jgi:hypothetical protein
LIMADTEEKVNKAKKLIHNVIETVSYSPHTTHYLMLIITGCLHSRRPERTQAQPAS